MEQPGADSPGALSVDPPGRLPGVDLDVLTAWMDRAVPGLRQGPLQGAVVAGGKSNLTYRITDGAQVWALRRPPLAHVLPTAHDMVREFTVISALSGTDVPVPHAIALGEPGDGLGAAFYLMSFVEGVVYDNPDRIAELDASAAAALGENLVDTLLALHDIEPGRVGLDDFGRPDGFLGRQVRRWSRQWAASETEPRPRLAEVVAALEDSLPESSAPGIVHGDYRLSNCIYAADPTDATIAAVVDWEMATIGDPLTDLGLLVVYHGLAETDDLVMPRLDPARGFLGVDALVARYAAGSTRALDRLPWYVGFGYFKLAVVAEGIHHRFLQGKTVGPGFDRFGEHVPGLLDRALEHLHAAH